jgi:Tfp pilus assembly protein FimT
MAELIEMLALLAVMAAIAVPSYLSAQPGLRLNVGVQEVLGKLIWALSKAVEQNGT